MKKENSASYRIEGLSCVNCAAKFEKNVLKLPGVTDAKVNFGAGKVTVYGQTTKKELEKAGAFENLVIVDENEDILDVHQKSFSKRNWQLIVTVGLILLAFYFQLTTSVFIGNIFFMLAVIIGGFQLFIEGFKNLLKFEFTMQTLMTVAIIGAVAIGEWAEGAVVVVLFAISEDLESYSMDKARNSIRSLMEITPKTALISRDGVEKTLSVREIQINDQMLIKPGEKIAMDGITIRGHSSVNQSAITGESIPIEKNVGDGVFAGTLNQEGILTVKVTKKVGDTTLAKIIQLVEEAQDKKASAQTFVDSFAKYYTPVIMLLAISVAVIPPLVFNSSWHHWLYQGLSLLVVGCPCALVISTPVSIVTAIGAAAKKGVLVKGGIYLEELGRLKAVAFDKTGTLTKGEPRVTDFKNVTDCLSDSEVFAKIAALESLSQHPLASSIMKEAEHKGIDYKSIQVQDFSSITGKGLTGKIDKTTYFIGSPKLFSTPLQQNSMVMNELQMLEKERKTIMLFGTKTDILGIIAVADELRTESHEVVKQLHELGIDHTILLSGDNQNTVDVIGRKAGVSVSKGNLMPEEKMLYLQELQKKYNKVAMIGDGVNDAPALAQATVGIAMGGIGTDTVLETADITLMNDDLKKLPFIIQLGRRTLRIIKQNITFSLVIKLVALLLVVPGWLTLWLAIVADMGATLLVTLNSMRLMKKS